MQKKGYDSRYGARPLSRVIQENIKKPLANELLFGKLDNGGTVRVIVTTKDDSEILDFEIIANTVKNKPSSKKKEKQKEQLAIADAENSDETKKEDDIKSPVPRVPHKRK